MPKSFQWITLLLIESIYFAGIRVKGLHTSVWIIPSKPSDLWEARPKSNFNGPLESTSKLQTIGPLGSTSKFNLWTSRKHVQDSNPSDLWEARPNFNPWTSGKHVQDSNPSDLWKHVQTSIHRTSGKHVQKIQIHQTIGKHVLYLFFIFSKKK